jgi:hypothetical protein
MKPWHGFFVYTCYMSPQLETGTCICFPGKPETGYRRLYLLSRKTGNW